jgi:UDP-2,3-diacylglucosamine hydrolase
MGAWLGEGPANFAAAGRFVKYGADRYVWAVLPSPCYIFSDAHLGFAPGGAEQATLEFLRALRGRAGSLVINGDLFEFWFEWKRVIPRPAFRILAALADLRESGIPVTMLAGNHDCWGGEVLRDDVGLDYRLDAFVGVAGGWRARIEHGDGLRDVEDARYRRLRTVLRHPLAKRAFRWLPPDAASGLAYGSSHASRVHSAEDEGAGLRSVAFSALAASDLELVAYGHSHVPELTRAPGGGVYANSGPWYDQRTFLVLDAERIVLRRWDGSAEGADLDALDRTPEKSLAQP